MESQHFRSVLDGVKSPEGAASGLVSDEKADSALQGKGKQGRPTLSSTKALSEKSRAARNGFSPNWGGKELSRKSLGIFFRVGTLRR